MSEISWSENFGCLILFVNGYSITSWYFERAIQYNVLFQSTAALAIVLDIANKYLLVCCALSCSLMLGLWEEFGSETEGESDRDDDDGV